MFTCIACTKTADGGEEVDGGARESGTPRSKEAVKSLTTQIKDMALKLSGTYKQCKPCPGTSSLKKGQRPYPDFDAASEGAPYSYTAGSSSSTPAWEYSTSATHHPGGRSDSRFATMYAGDRTPGGAGRESISAQSCDVVVEEDGEPKEWMAQVEPGVHITFVSLPTGGNDLKRIRFSRDMFDKWQAQRWWGENFDRIMELYNVQRFNQQAFQTPARSDIQRDSSYSMVESVRESPMMHSTNQDWTPRHYRQPPGSLGGQRFYGGGSSGPGRPSLDPSRITTSSRGDEPPSLSNASEMEAEWVEEDESGVHITIRQLADGTRELRRVRFSREKFGEVHAKTWWEQNRDRIQAQYL